MSDGRRLAVLAALTVLVTGVLAVVATWVEHDGIESRLTERAGTALIAADLPANLVSFAGRDATVTARSPREALLAKAVVTEVDGVRAVSIATGEPAPPRGPHAEPHAAVDPDAAAKSRLQRSLDRALAREPIGFRPNSTRLTAGGRDAVDTVADLLDDAPPDWRFEVGGHVARVSGTDPESVVRLSEARAEVVAEELVDEGLSSDQVRSVGYGDTRPLPGGGTSSADRRVEITVR